MSAVRFPKHAETDRSKHRFGREVHTLTARGLKQNAHQAVREMAQDRFTAFRCLRIVRKFVLEAVKKEGRALEYADQALKQDKEFQLELEAHTRQ